MSSLRTQPDPTLYTCQRGFVGEKQKLQAFFEATGGLLNQHVGDNSLQPVQEKE